MTQINKSRQDSIIDGKRIFKAANVKRPHPVFLDLAESLSQVDALHFIKIFNDRICASNLLSTDRKKRPITKMDVEGTVGVELIIDPDNSIVQFFSLVSHQQGYGRKIVDAIVQGTPDDWSLVVVMDWSEGFWNRMHQDYPQIVVF